MNSAASLAYRRYVLGMLTLVYTMNFIDRNLMFLLLQPIKEDLRLSDTQLGFLTGIAFGLFYAVLGIPLARWADRGNRVTLTSAAIGLWGLTVMSCMFVGNFAQMALARVAAAIGEAGCMPPTYSLLGDYFSKPAERIHAMAIYWLGAPISALASLIVGGWLNEQYGWRLTFFVMGLPALVVAVVIRSTVAELRPGASASAQMPAAPLRQVVAGLWRRRTTRHLGTAIVLHFALSAGAAPWYAAFLIRRHGMGTADLGLWLGLIFGGSGIVGILAGGFIATRWFSDDERAQLRMSAVLNALLLPCFVAFLLVPEKYAALLSLLPLGMVFVFVNGPTFALLQRLAPDNVRATTIAVVMLFANLIGMGVGPQIVGVLSDLLEPIAGKDALRYAILSVSCLALWAAFHFWRAGDTVRGDLMSITERSSADKHAGGHQPDAHSSSRPVPS